MVRLLHQDRARPDAEYYYKKSLTKLSSIQIVSGALGILAFVIEWKVFGFLVPLYIIGAVHFFSGGWCLIEVYRRGKITSGLFVIATVVALCSALIAGVQMVFSIVIMCKAREYAEYYRSMDSHLTDSVDSPATIEAFAVLVLLIGALSMASAIAQALICIGQLKKKEDTYSLPVRYLTKVPDMSETMTASTTNLVPEEPDEPVATIMTM